VFDTMHEGDIGVATAGIGRAGFMQFLWMTADQG
jgi:hypothetical protein